MDRPLIRSIGPGVVPLGLGLLAIGLMKFDSNPVLSQKPYPRANKPQIVEAYHKLPLSFEANQGQTDPQVRFLSRGNGYTFFLTPTETVLALYKPAAPTTYNSREVKNTTGAVLRMKLVGANPSPVVTPLEELPSKSNYFIGNDPTKWRTNVPHYAKVLYKDVYPGVDLVYYGNQKQLEFDFVVAPSPSGMHLSRN